MNKIFTRQTFFFFASILLISISMMIRSFYIAELRTKLETLIQTNQMMSNYQGMKFDLTGLGPFISFNVRKNNDFHLLSQKIQFDKNVLERTYHQSSSFYLNKIIVKVVENNVSLEVVVQLTLASQVKILTYSLLLSALCMGLILFMKMVFEARRSSDLAYLAKQVSHDIRSPLAALNVAISSLRDIDEDKKILINSAYRRINDIANNLLTQNRKSIVASSRRKSPILISRLIESMISEKRLLLEDDSVLITIEYRNNSLDTFALVNKIEFERVLSNLINNSIEALEDRGGVIQVIIEGDSQLIVSIKDNGPGIPEDVLKNLGTIGVTSKRFKGNNAGLGIPHAFKTLNEVSGKLLISSSKDTGTEVKLVLPVCDKPDWFKMHMQVRSGSKVVVMDNDESVHNIWKEKIKNYPIELLHFYTPLAFKEWYSSSKNLNIFLLCDFDFPGCKYNGIDIIKDSKLQNSALLVTSFLDDDVIVDQCTSNHIAGLPKAFIEHLNIEVIEKDNIYDLVLIDDDKYIKLAWKSTASSHGLKLLALDSVECFMRHHSHLRSNIPIFIDSNLANGIKGEVASQVIFDLNFENLYISTGYSRDEMNKPFWIKDIVGKDPDILVKLFHEKK